MPHHKSCLKRMRTSSKEKASNHSARSRMNSFIKKVLSCRKKSEGEEALKSAVSVIDKTIKSGVIHKNSGAHKKARLSRHVAGLK